MSRTAADSVKPFIVRWQSADGGERANYLLFIGELAERLAAVAQLFAETPAPLTLEQIADTLVALGKAQAVADGRWARYLTWRRSFQSGQSSIRHPL